MLLEITQFLDEHQISYHLEGGTLLGIVRDQDLLPWDVDLDISIPSECSDSLIKLKIKFFLMGYKLSVRRNELNYGPLKIGDIKMIKIKPLAGYVLKWLNPKFDHLTLDIFVKYSDADYVYWRAVDKVMRVDRKYYLTKESIHYFGATLHAPNDYTGYLTRKYGDWKIALKEWSCNVNEKTIVQDANGLL